MHSRDTERISYQSAEAGLLNAELDFQRKSQCFTLCIVDVMFT